MANEIYKTRIEEIWIDEKEIIYIKTIPNAYSEIENAQESVSLSIKLAQNKKHFFIIDVSAGRGASRESFKYYGSAEVASICKGAAVIKNSPLSNIVANFFMGIYKPLYPMQLFDSYEQAYKWFAKLEKEEMIEQNKC
jgi:hypothetical protein